MRRGNGAGTRRWPGADGQSDTIAAMPNDQPSASAQSGSAASDALRRLPLPDTNLRGLLRHLGPGLILMMTGVGTSHLVTAPAAGGRFEYALLWCIPVA